MTLNGKICIIVLIVLGMVNCPRLFLSKSIEEGSFYVSVHQCFTLLWWRREEYIRHKIIFKIYV